MLGQPRVIDLAIRGKELVLAGKFNHWVPMSLETGGARSEAEVLFDVTATGPANDASELFAFVSNDVRSMGEGAYLAQGVMRQGDTECVSEAVIHVPATHSPFAVVTFRMDETTFPKVWSDLSARVAARGGSRAEVRPRAWLTPPALAAA